MFFFPEPAMATENRLIYLNMKRYLPILLAGVVTLPVIFDMTRRGSLLLAMTLVMLMAAAGVGVAYSLGEIKTWTCALVYALGVVLVEVYYFISWYVAHGSEAEQGSGLTIAIAEASMISMIGGTAAFLTCTVLQRYR
jgi:hypothetical protein